MVLFSVADGFGRRVKGSGLRPAFTDAARPVIAGLDEGADPDVEPLAVGLDGSASGGGVGGNIFLLTGGSDCCREREARPGFTRLDAAKEIPSGGLSSFPLVGGIMDAFFASEPANPVKAFP